MKNRAPLTITLLLIAILLAGCSEKANHVPADNSPIIPVRIGTVSEGNGSSLFTASGMVEAEQSANISTRIMGHITKVYVKMGQKVIAGQALVSVQNSDLQAKKAQTDASILQANAAYLNAKKDYDRFMALFAQQSASQKELDDMTSRYEIAKAGLEGAEQMGKEVAAQFSYTHITAPFSGIVTNTFVKEGDMANPGMPLIGLESPNRLQVTALVSESAIESIKNGMEVTVLLKSTDQKINGKVSEVSPSSHNTGGQYPVKIDLGTIDRPVLSGMFVNVQFPLKKKADIPSVDRVLVPKSALIQQGQLTGIYTVGENNTALLRWLRTGNTLGDQMEILSGLSVGESYVATADGRLYNGAKISIQ